jgi:predicted dehydrogenase
MLSSPSVALLAPAPASPTPGLKRYAIVGLGIRSKMYSEAILDPFRENAALVGFCDVNRSRMEYYNRRFAERYQAAPVPMYSAAGFPRLIAEQAPDTVIVTSVDRTHHEYIIAALDLGCDVITEKPMTVDAGKCAAILEAVERTGRQLKVAFNYRYSPARAKVKELLHAGTIGQVTSVHFEWLLDTNHGADYFRRWHREKHNSGGLLVHKSTHHFDLVNWWLGSSPESVFGYGSLAFYGRANALRRGVEANYPRGTSPEAHGQPFAFNLRDGGELEHLYLTSEHEDGYRRDQNVFGEGITIEDTAGAVVRYRNGAVLTYSLTTYAPWEGYRIAFNGTKGRLEFDEMEVAYHHARTNEIAPKAGFSQRMVVYPQFAPPWNVELPPADGAHSGGDRLLLQDLFSPTPAPDPLGRAAGHEEGARSILTGAALNHSFETGLPVRIDTLI